VAVRRFLDKKPMPAATGARSTTRQLGGNHLGIVKNQAITGRQQMRQIADVVMENLPSPAVHDHQPGVGAVAERLLGDQLPRDFKIELEGFWGRHDGLNPRIAASRTPSLRLYV
jgi:hypothetical protein